jgi:capping protein beta
MVRQVEQDLPVEDDSSHVANVGRLVEDMEGKMRNLLRTSIILEQEKKSFANIIPEEVYFGKAKDVVGDLRSTS